MPGSLSVLSQYVTSLHRMSTEVMQSVFSRGLFPAAQSTRRHQCLGCIVLAPRWWPWVYGVHRLGRELTGWKQYLILIAVRDVPNAWRDCPGEHLH